MCLVGQKPEDNLNLVAEQRGDSQERDLSPSWTPLQDLSVPLLLPVIKISKHV